MKELEELTAEIREKLPRLKELSEGQNLISNIDDPSTLICKDELFTIGKFDCELSENDIDNEIVVGGYYYQVGKDFEIVGKEPMLNDVLQFVKIIASVWKIEDIMSSIIINWEMNFPYLKDQSYELISFLHSLIKK